MESFLAAHVDGGFHDAQAEAAPFVGREFHHASAICERHASLHETDLEATTRPARGSNGKLVPYVENTLCSIDYTLLRVHNLDACETCGQSTIPFPLAFKVKKKSRGVQRRLFWLVYSHQCDFAEPPVEPLGFSKLVSIQRVKETELLNEEKSQDDVARLLILAEHLIVALPDVNDWAEVRRLHDREQLSKSAIARRLGMTRHTVVRLLARLL